MTTQTIKGVVNAMSKEQKNVLYFLIGQAVDEALSGKSKSSVAQSGLDYGLSHSDGKTIKDVISSYTSEQKDTLAFLMGKAVEEALGTPSEEELEQSIFDDTEEFLAHYGVKGMKWGVRRYQKKDGTLTAKGRKREARESRATRDAAINKKHQKRWDDSVAKGEGTDARLKNIAEDRVIDLQRSKKQEKFDRMSAKKLEKADRKYANTMNTMAGQIELNNNAARYFNENIVKLNSKYPDGVDLVDPKAPNYDAKLSKKYMSDVESLQLDCVKKAAELMGVSPSGKSKFEAYVHPENGHIDVRVVPNDNKVKHADEDDGYDTIPIIRFKPTKKNGRITGYDLVKKNTLEQSIFDETEEFLAHYGVKGMKWGVRKDRTGKRRTKDEKARSDRKALSKKRRTLESGEIDDLVKRLENEKKLKKLVEQDLNPGRAFAKDILETAGKRALPTMIAGATLYGVKTAIDHEFSTGGLADAVFRGGAKKK